MPWTCESCGRNVDSDDLQVCECGARKASWTIMPDRTRPLVVPTARKRFEALRGSEAAAGGDWKHAEVAWAPTTVISALPKRRVLELAARGERPHPHDVLCVRLFPREGAAAAPATLDVTTTVLFEWRASAEHVVGVQRETAPADPQGGVPLHVVCAFGPEAIARDALPGFVVLDVTELTPTQAAPALEVHALKGKPARLQLEPQVEEPITRALLRGLFFETDRTFLLPSAMPGLGRLKRFYESHPTLRELLVVGHADTTGAAAYNLRLSEERAAAVVAWLRDDVPAWTRWYTTTPGVGKPWGTREDQHMLTQVPDRRTPFYAGPITGVRDGPTIEATRAFQEWSNARRGTQLVVDGIAGPATREELVRAYMDLDGARLPDALGLVTHGCGEFHPEVPTADGVDEPANRRVEMFFFGPPGVEPPAPPQGCVAPGCVEYPEWRRRTVRTIDLSAEPGHLALRVVEEGEAQSPIAAAALTLEGLEVRSGKSGPLGEALFPDLLAGKYLVHAQHASFQAKTIEVDVKGGDLVATDVPANAQSFAPDGGGGGGGGGGGPVPVVTGEVIELIAVLEPPTVTSFLGKTKRKATGVDTKPAERVIVDQGQRVTLLWTIEGDFDSVRIGPAGTEVPKGADGRPVSEMSFDPRNFPPDEQGDYTLRVSNGGVQATPAPKVALVGIAAFDVEHVEGEAGRLLDVSGKKVVPAVSGRAGGFEFTEAKFRAEGQVDPKSVLRFSWRLFGAPDVRAVFKTAGKTALDLRQDVTDITRGDDIYEPGDSGELEYTEPNGQAALQAVIELFDEDDQGQAKGSALCSSVIPLRLNRPFPEIVSVKVLHASKVTSDGATVPSWEAIEVAWELTGDFAENELELTVRDGGPTGAVRVTKLLKPKLSAVEGTPRRPEALASKGRAFPGGGPFLGTLFFEVRLMRLKDGVRVQSMPGTQGRRTHTLQVAPPPPGTVPPGVKHIRLRLVDVDGDPMVNVGTTLSWGSDIINPPNTDAKGELAFDLPDNTVREGILFVDALPGSTDAVELHVQLTSFAKLSDIEGVRGRLANLGYMFIGRTETLSGAVNDRDRAALDRFRAHNHIVDADGKPIGAAPPTDSDTLDRLEDAHDKGGPLTK